MARPIFCRLADLREIPWRKHGRALWHYHCASESQILGLSRSTWDPMPLRRSGSWTAEEFAHPFPRRKHLRQLLSLCTRLDSASRPCSKLSAKVVERHRLNCLNPCEAGGFGICHSSAE